jgi:hypothetical protein
MPPAHGCCINFTPQLRLPTHQPLLSTQHSCQTPQHTQHSCQTCPSSQTDPPMLSDRQAPAAVRQTAPCCCTRALLTTAANLPIQNSWQTGPCCCQTDRPLLLVLLAHSRQLVLCHQPQQAGRRQQLGIRGPGAVQDGLHSTARHATAQHATAQHTNVAVRDSTACGPAHGPAQHMTWSSTARCETV